MLSYFTDDSKRRLKGSICLDECEQVDKGLKDVNGKYSHMFNIKTRKRLYHLAVDSNDEMDTWVRMVCNACGLRAATDEDSSEAAEIAAATTTTPQISSPYIHISECYTGRRPGPTRNHSWSSSPHFGGADFARCFADDIVFEDSNKVPQRGATATWNGVLPAPPEFTISSLRIAPQSDLEVLPPDRPPKPPHLMLSCHTLPVDVTADNYENAFDMQEAMASLKLSQEEFNNNQSQSKSAEAAPSVMRSLKPGRKSICSGAVTIAGSQVSLWFSQAQTTSGPPVERTLKPKNSVGSNGASTLSFINHKNAQFRTDSKDEDSSEADSNSEDWLASNGLPYDSGEEIYYYMPRLSATSTLGGKNQPLMIPAESFEHPALEYIDLDLEKSQCNDFPKLHPGDTLPSARSTGHINADNSPKTIYKTIDIEKTEAFNRTKKERAEENQRQKTDRHKK